MLSAVAIAAQLGVTVDDLLSEPLWLDTGAHQLMVPLKSADAVRRARPDTARLGEWEFNKAGRQVAYLFAFDGKTGDAVPGADGDDDVKRVLARYFFGKPGGGVVEDPGTGSACANLGGWCIATGRTLPARIRVEQGEQAGRPCILGLEVTADRQVRVSGQVLELGSGTITVP